MGGFWNNIACSVCLPGNSCQPILGPANHDAFDPSDLPVSPYEHYLVKHPSEWYECLKCHKTGKDVKQEPCWPKESPDYLSKNWKLPYKMSKPEDGEKKVDQVDQVHQVDHEETLLAALLEEELALSQMLEEAMALSMSAVTTPPTHDQEDQENLQKAIALSFTELPKNKEQEVDSKKRDEDFEMELALSVADPPKDTSGSPSASPAATDELSQLCSEKNIYNMQCLVNMGFSKEHAIWGVKRANDGDGSIDLALQHASWRCDADHLLAKRQKLENMTRNVGAVPPDSTNSGPPCAYLRCFLHSQDNLKCIHKPQCDFFWDWSQIFFYFSGLP